MVFVSKLRTVWKDKNLIDIRKWRAFAFSVIQEILLILCIKGRIIENNPSIRIEMLENRPRDSVIDNIKIEAVQNTIKQETCTSEDLTATVMKR